MRKKDIKIEREKERERDDPVINMQCVKFFLPAKVVTRKKGGHTKQKKWIRPKIIFLQFGHNYCFSR